MESARQNVYYKMAVPEEELTEEERERYKKAMELYEYRKKTKGLSTQFNVEYIFHFIKEWDTARKKLKNAGGW
ncbi:MAG: hypothetical protein HFJ09_09690 [Lachnospiraceae bacterium]|nr:hypothetical protein [Lachnospiraceae bacterium]